MVVRRRIADEATRWPNHRFSANIPAGLPHRFMLEVMLDYLPEEDEVEGIDFTEHGETAYELTSRGGAGSRLASPAAATPAATPSDEGALA